jgi:hypothetical protein
MGSRKEYDRTVTDGSWEAMGYDGADDDDRMMIVRNVRRKGLFTNQSFTQSTATLS